MCHLSLISCSQLHTSELNDGYDWGRLNLQSVTEQSSMDDFLATAELAGTEFVAGKWRTRRNWNPKILGCVCCHPECFYLSFPREAQHSVCASRSSSWLNNRWGESQAGKATWEKQAFSQNSSPVKRTDKVIVLKVGYYSRHLFSSSLDISLSIDCLHYKAHTGMKARVERLFNRQKKTLFWSGGGALHSV